MNEKFYVTDCEGPLSINDNAYEIADYLNVSRSYLTGESNAFITRLAEKRTELSAADSRSFLNDFMISRGFAENYCNSLNDADLDHIEEFIAYVAKTHENVISNMVSYGQLLEERIKALEDNNSHKD